MVCVEKSAISHIVIFQGEWCINCSECKTSQKREKAHGQYHGFQPDSLILRCFAAISIAVYNDISGAAKLQWFMRRSPQHGTTSYKSTLEGKLNILLYHTSKANLVVIVTKIPFELTNFKFTDTLPNGWRTEPCLQSLVQWIHWHSSCVKLWRCPRCEHVRIPSRRNPVTFENTW